MSLRRIGYAWARHARKTGRDEFSCAIGHYLGAESSYTFTSFVRAIYACLIALRRSDKRTEVILPRYCCPDFTRAVLAAQLEIRYCDVNPATLSLDLASLQNTDFQRVLALICVNHFGLSNPMDEVSSLCRTNGIYLIEDLGYSLGTEFNGRRLGTFGDFAVLNLREGKAIPIGGGMVVTNNSELMRDSSGATRPEQAANMATMLAYRFFSNPHMYYLLVTANRLLGFSLQARFSMEDIGRGSGEESGFRFDMDRPLKVISNFQGALGLATLANLEEHMRLREKNASALEAGLSQSKTVSTIRREPGCGRVHYIRYPVLVDRRLRERIHAELLRRGIESAAMYPEVKPEATRFPGAARVSQEILTLPCHPGVKQRDLDTIVSVFQGIDRNR